MEEWTRGSSLEDELSEARVTYALLTAGSPVPHEMPRTQEVLKLTACT